MSLLLTAFWPSIKHTHTWITLYWTPVTVKKLGKMLILFASSSNTFIDSGFENAEKKIKCNCNVIPLGITDHLEFRFANIFVHHICDMSLQLSKSSIFFEKWGVPSWRFQTIFQPFGIRLAVIQPLLCALTITSLGNSSFFSLVQNFEIWDECSKSKMRSNSRRTSLFHPKIMEKRCSLHLREWSW